MIDFNLKGRHLYRSPRHGIIGGIAAGLGTYLDVDAVFVRLVWLAVAVLTHIWPMILLYGVLFYIVPINPAEDTVPSRQEPKDVTPAHKEK